MLQTRTWREHKSEAGHSAAPRTPPPLALLLGASNWLRNKLLLCVPPPTLESPRDNASSNPSIEIRLAAEPDMRFLLPSSFPAIPVSHNLAGSERQHDLVLLQAQLCLGY